jgi:hypothetical protein
MPYKNKEPGLIAIALDDLKRTSPDVHAQVVKDIDAGAQAEMECSSFTDPGDDWSRLLVNGKSVIERSGY